MEKSEMIKFMNTIKSTYITAYKNGSQFLGHGLDAEYLAIVLHKTFKGLSRVPHIENPSLGLHRFYVDQDGNYFEVKEERR